MLSIKNVSVEFKGAKVKAVDDFSLDVNDGERVAIVGETGSGKSVLIVALIRLLPNNAQVSGQVFLDGEDILTANADRLHEIRGGVISYVPQGGGGNADFIRGAAAGGLGQILAHEEAGDRDCFAEKPVRHGDDLDGDRRRGIALRQAPDRRRGEHPGQEQEAARPARRRQGKGGKRLGTLILQQAEHPDSILNLAIGLIFLRGGNGTAGEAVKLIRGEDQAGAIRGKKIALIREELIQEGRGGRGIEEAELLQMLTVAGDANGYDGQGLHRGKQGGEIMQGPVQHLPVVEAGTEDNLAVKLQPVIPQGAELVHEQGGPGIAQEADPDLRIRGMDGDIQRGSLTPENTRKLGVIHIGKGDIIAHHHGKAPVIVLDIEGAAHARRHLVDEAEHAPVGAGPGREHNGLVQADAQRLPILFIDGEAHRHPVALCLQ